MAKQDPNVNVEQLRGKPEPIADFLKMKLVDLQPGYAKSTMKITQDHINFNGGIYGAIIVAVADQAFAYASNSMAFPSVGTQFNIHWINGAVVGDELTAEARVVRSGRRVGLTEVTVTNQEGKLIAKASGTTIPIFE